MRSHFVCQLQSPATMSEDDLAEIGFSKDESLVKITKKIVCSKCKSKAVSAYRYVEDELQPVFPQ